MDVALIAAVTFGILELKTESDYEKAVSQVQKDDLENKGNRYALLTNVGIVTAAGGRKNSGSS